MIDRQPQTGRLMRIAYHAVNRTLRGQVVSVTGYQGATWFDSPRIKVKLVQDDGSLGEEYLVLPGILISL